MYCPESVYVVELPMGSVTTVVEIILPVAGGVRVKVHKPSGVVRLTVAKEPSQFMPLPAPPEYA